VARCLEEEGRGEAREGFWRDMTRRFQNPRCTAKLGVRISKGVHARAYRGHDDLVIKLLTFCALPGDSVVTVTLVRTSRTVFYLFKRPASELILRKCCFLNVEAPPVSHAFGHVESSRLVPRGAHSSPITIQQKHYHRATG